MMGKFITAMFVLLALASVAHSQNWDMIAYNEVLAQWAANSWGVLSALALFTAFFIVIIAYMVSTIFGSKELRTWAKAELLQSMASAMMVLAFLFLVGVLISSASQIAANLAPTNPPLPPTLHRENPFALAHYYLDIQINCAKKYYRTVFWFTLFVEPIEKTILPTGGMEEVTGWALSGPIGFCYWITNQLSFLLMVNYFQRHLLLFIEDNMFTFFLPLGILLRVLPYTRGAGGVIMSVALGLFLVYPLMYAVFLGVMPRPACSVVAPVVHDYEASDTVWAALSMAFMDSSKSFMAIQGFTGNILDEIRLIFISSIVFPLVNITITLTFIRSSMQFLGADVAEMGQGIIKII